MVTMRKVVWPGGHYNDTTYSDGIGLDSTRQGTPDSEHQTMAVSAVALAYRLEVKQSNCHFPPELSSRD